MEDADVHVMLMATQLMLEDVANSLIVKKVCVAILNSPNVAEKVTKLALVSSFCSLCFVNKYMQIIIKWLRVDQKV